MENTFQSYADRNSMLAKSFKNMACGLVITGATAALMYTSGIYYYVVTRIPLIGLVMLLAQIILTFKISRTLTRYTEVRTMKFEFIIYSLMMGFTMSSLGYVYNLGQISTAFIVSAIYFICLAIIGKTTQRDLSKLGTICFAGLIAMLVTQLLLTLFRVSIDARLWSAIGLLVFSGLAAWDIQKIERMPSFYDNSKMAVYFALQLYLDFINIFMYILELIGNKND